MLNNLVPPDSPTIRWFPECKFILDTAPSSAFESSDDEIESSPEPSEEIEIRTDYNQSIIRQYRKKEMTRNISLSKFSKVQNSGTLKDRNLAQKLIIRTSAICGMSEHTTATASRMFDYLLCTIEIQREEIPLLAATCIFVTNKLEGEEIYGICEKISQIIGSIDENSIIKEELKILVALNFDTQFTTSLMYAEILKTDPQFLTTPRLSEDFETLTTAIIFSTMMSDKCFECSGETIARAALLIAQSLITKEPIDPSHLKEITPVKECICNAILSEQKLLFGVFPMASQFIDQNSIAEL